MCRTNVLQDDKFLCSELIQVSAGGKVEIGNLELISSAGCTLTVAAELPVGAVVKIRCLECPLGKKPCKECRFRGKVRHSNVDPVLGCLMDIDFEGRIWSPQEWKPRHLTKVRSVIAAAPRPSD